MPQAARVHSTTTRHESFCSLACPYQSTPGCRHREAATTKRLANTRRILRARYGQAGAVDSAMRCLRVRGQCVVNVWGGCVVAVAPQTFTKSTKMMLSTCVTSMINSAKVHKHQQQAALPVRHTCRMSCKRAKGTSSSRYSRAISLAPS